jgi:hypothetical protein
MAYRTSKSAAEGKESLENFGLSYLNKSRAFTGFDDTEHP